MKNWQIELLYDGECPLCLREVNFLRNKDRGRGLVNFVDIAQADYNPQDHGGVSFEDAMARIHAVKADGTVIKNVAVFREVYEVLGIGWLYAPTRWPIIGPLVDRIYDFWADRRLSWTGRPSLAEILAQREKGMCANGGCALPVAGGSEAVH
ncbi:thiol-disulfide oxidoreductase DCC family protein [Synechocystis salina LEGE 06099]|uniref:thiol-disulfide oxidoreductase DCC family protein n=1 Tax=Synechocystis salina TaxID=945780 RepID=UPI00187F39D6|nr:thiol-disulfide oxidoreductase DCC family protein [Synechocystis salina]MBE9203054.1 thiol-disulfide oxidoreductase DCC family protein [Synechocystis salina LEGE 06099]